MMQKKESAKNKNKEMAIIQLAVLVISIIAFGYLIGSEARLVSASDPGDYPNERSNLQEAPVTDAASVLAFLSKTPITNPVEKLVSSLKISTPEIAPIPESSIPAMPEVPEVSEPGFLGDLLIKANINPAVASGINDIVVGSAIALGTYIGVKWLAKAAGLKEGGSKAAGYGAAAGMFWATGLAPLLSVSGWWGAPIALIVFLATFKDEKTEKVIFTCSLWQPVAGGNHCDECNKGDFPCSAYQCASLGVSCQIVNQGTTDQKCIWVDRNNVNPPVMTPLQSALKNGYSYSNDSAVSPPNRGVKVLYSGSSDGCIPSYTSFSFGVQVDKESKCKIDVERKGDMDSMNFSLDGGRYLKEHSITLTVPNSEDLKAENITNAFDLLGSPGSYKLYIRCMNGNAVESNADFEFSYCIQQGPDLNPPEIEETSISNGAYVAAGIGSVNLTVSVNKPSECRWSTLDKSYDNMENQMSCATNVRDSNPKLLYDCKTALTGIKDRADNSFYFRCKGTYNAKANPVSYPFTLKGTEALVIDNAGPNETIKDSTNVVKVNLTAKTSAGAENGKATCLYSKTGQAGSYITFYNTDSYTHSQELDLLAGDYTYYINCIDAGGNMDNATTSFSVETDNSAPAVVRAFHDTQGGDYLKIITNEEADCVYDNTNCNYEFDAGTPMTSLDNIEHFVSWNTNLNFYIKCRDNYGNQPVRDQCSITAKPFNL
jgi:hypothetical protein